VLFQLATKLPISTNSISVVAMTTLSIEYEPRVLRLPNFFNAEPIIAKSMSTPAIHFAKFLVTSKVFYATKLSAALVNLKPILPGHSLVIPRRNVPRYTDLSAEEVADLFLRQCGLTIYPNDSVQRVGKVLEKVYNSSSLTIAIQVTTPQ